MAAVDERVYIKRNADHNQADIGDGKMKKKIIACRLKFFFTNDRENNKKVPKHTYDQYEHIKDYVGTNKSVTHPL